MYRLLVKASHRRERKKGQAKVTVAIAQMRDNALFPWSKRQSERLIDELEIEKRADPSVVRDGDDEWSRRRDDGKKCSDTKFDGC